MKKIILIIVLFLLASLTTIYFVRKSEKNGPATISIKKSIKNNNFATAFLFGENKITWQTKNYPKNAGVDINLIQKVSENPKEFLFIRKIAENTKNDGEESWVPTKDDLNKKMFIEVVCSSTYEFKNGCSLINEPIPVD